MSSVQPSPFEFDETAELLGDLHPLVEQLGSTEGLLGLAATSLALTAQTVASERDLENFLKAYQDQLLFPLELPAIARAYGHVMRNEVRELVSYDAQLALEDALKPFKAASCRVGQAQLRRLLPLRDARAVQRYRLAVEEERAQGWHTLVYGLTLAIYSLPLRQGLLNYAWQTQRGFLHAASRPLRLGEAQFEEIFQRVAQGFPERIAPLLAPGAAPAIAIC